MGGSCRVAIFQFIGASIVSAFDDFGLFVGSSGCWREGVRLYIQIWTQARQAMHRVRVSMSRLRGWYIVPTIVLCMFQMRGYVTNKIKIILIICLYHGRRRCLGLDSLLFEFSTFRTTHKTLPNGRGIRAGCVQWKEMLLFYVLRLHIQHIGNCHQDLRYIAAQTYVCKS